MDDGIGGPNANRVAKVAFDAFASIPKTGKPISGKEWTVLTCIAKLNKQSDHIEIVALGTGWLN